ncbi:MAG: DUF3857 domain-containing transglutaminase family protein [Bacteroidetes bacterium]|nr:DUF3857 domain-containing transglutaminase family protein [Bacteroidota bacterium]
MKKFNLSLVFLISAFSLFAGDLKYPVSAIPAELKENVDAVIREDHMRFTILDKNRANFYAHMVITIFNENGNDYASETVLYSKLIKVIDINGFVYNAEGKQIKKLKNSEIYDQSAFDGFSLYSDNRIKAINLTQATYPYTVEIEYEIEYKYLYAIPSSQWGHEKVSYQKASYQLIFPPNLAPHYQLLNIDRTPAKAKTEDGKESLTWTFENILPVKTEPYSPGRELIPKIIAAPSVFEYDGYAGSMNSWQEYGLWNSALNKDRDILPDATKQKVKSLLAGLTTTEQKAKAIYEYLQSKTRYVSIQLGIGGLQPFPASMVDETGYGDCKALSNYAVAMLKEAGIKGYYTVIEAGERAPAVKKDFPSHQFNHVVVSIPNGKDTLWLECTSQTNPFGYQGTFTEDRWALMITEQGGKLVRTINYTPEQNLQSRTADVILDAAGNGTAKIRTTEKGIQYENDDLNFTLNNQEKQKKWLERNTDIPNFSINSFSMKEVRDKVPSAIINLDLKLSRYASVSGKRLFLSPNLMNKTTRVPPKVTERKTDVVLRNNYLDYDTIKFTVPENLYPEFMPEPVKINSKFGEYSASFQFDAGKVTYIRRMKMWKGRYPKETYNDLIEFYKNVSKADNIKLVFLNKT